MKTRKILNAALGLLAGIVTAPLAAIAWPAFCAVFLWNEVKQAYNYEHCNSEC